MAVYPGAIDNFPQPTPTTRQDVESHSALHQAEGNAIVAIETALGVRPAGSSATVGDRIAANETALAAKADAAATATALALKADAVSVNAALGTKVDASKVAPVGLSGHYADLTGQPAVPVQASDINAVPVTRTVNNKPLSANVVLVPADIGAATAAQGTKADSAIQAAVLAQVATSGQFADLQGRPTIPQTPHDVGAASAAQGAKADTAVQPGQLATVATSGLYADLQGNPVVPNTPAQVGAASAAQGAKADTAVQPGQLATVATSGAFGDLSGRPPIPATAGDIGAATVAQGAKADTAVQPNQLAVVATTGVYSDLSGRPFIPENLADLDDLATAEQGAKADTAVQPGQLAPVAFSGDYLALLNVPDIPSTPDDVGAASADQGALADSAVQPADLAVVASTGAYDDLTGLPTIPIEAGDIGAATADQGALADSAVQSTDLASVALTGDYNDLQNIPTGPVTPADIGAATSDQGALADTSVQPDDLAVVAGTGSFFDLIDAPAVPVSPDDIGAAWAVRQVTSGAGLLGGGDLSSDLLLEVDFGGTGESDQVAHADHTHTFADIGGVWDPGDIKMAGYLDPNDGWLLCDGSDVVQADYPALYAAIGTNFGTSADPTHMFRLPNLLGRFPRGATSGTPSVGGGNNNHSHTVPGVLHSHTVPAHSHTLGPAGWAQITIAAVAPPNFFMRRVTAANWTATVSDGWASGATGSSAVEALGAGLDGATDNSVAIASGNTTPGTATSAPSANVPLYTDLNYFIKT